MGHPYYFITCFEVLIELYEENKAFQDELRICKLWSAKKALLEVTYHIVKIHVNNDVTIVLEFLIFLVVKKIEENYPK